MNAAPSEALAAICSRPCCPEDVIGQAKGILMGAAKDHPGGRLRPLATIIPAPEHHAGGGARPRRNREYRMVKPSATPTKQSGRSHSLGSNAECDHRHLPRCF